MTDYRPSFLPGARLPCFSWQRGKIKHNSADFVRYDRFTLFVADAELAGWKKAVANAGLRAKPGVIALPEMIFTAGHQRALREILKGGALLVRPDGHVAAQMGSGSVAGAQALQQVFDQLGFRSKPVLSVRRLAS